MSRGMGKVVAMLVFGVWIALAGSVMPGAALGAEPYPLGVALGLSGTGAPWAKEAVEGIRLAVEEINGEGGFLGTHPVELFVKDTETDPKIAARVARELIRDHGVRCVIGTYSSATSLAVKPILRENRVLQIATISNSEDITKLDFSPYTFSVVPNTYMMSKAGVVGVSKLAKRKGWKTYVTIASDYAWGRSSQKIKVELLKEIAPEIRLLGAYWPRLGQTRFNSFIVAILALKADFVLADLAGADIDIFLRDSRDYHFFRKVAYPDGIISVTELISQSKSLRRGISGRTRAPFFAHMDVPMMAHFVEHYRAKYGRYPSDWAVMAYDGVYALKQGIQKAGSINTEKVKNALKGMTVDTTRGRLTFRKIDNQLSCSSYFGTVADDPRYPFPILKDLVELKAPDNWRPENEILSDREEGARKGKTSE